MTQHIMCNHGYHLFKCQKCIDALVADEIQKQEQAIKELRHALGMVLDHSDRAGNPWIAIYAKVIEKLFTLVDAANCPQCGDKSGAYYDNNGEVCQCQWCYEVGKLKTNWDGRS